MKILLVDDNPKMRRIVRELIGSAHIEFYEASDWDEAVRSYADIVPIWW